MTGPVSKVIYSGAYLPGILFKLYAFTTLCDLDVKELTAPEMETNLPDNSLLKQIRDIIIPKPEFNFETRQNMISTIEQILLSYLPDRHYVNTQLLRAVNLLGQQMEEYLFVYWYENVVYLPVSEA